MTRSALEWLLAALLSFAALAAVLFPLERAYPSRSPSPWRARLNSLDTVFFFGQYLCWATAAALVLTAVQPWAAQAFPEPWVSTFRAQPFGLQVLEAVALADLSGYWFHRACHRFEVLWRFHSVHHSAPEVDWLAAHREHPLDGLFTQLALNLPLMLLQLPLSAIAGVVAFRGLWAIFVHSNVRLPLGPLGWLLGAPQLHRWHHAQLGMARHNFANLAPYWDWLFGTYHRPVGEEAWAVGLGRPSAGYWGLLLGPFGAVEPRRSAGASKRHASAA